MGEILFPRVTVQSLPYGTRDLAFLPRQNSRTDFKLNCCMLVKFVVITHPSAVHAFHPNLYLTLTKKENPDIQR